MASRATGSRQSGVLDCSESGWKTSYQAVDARRLYCGMYDGMYGVSLTTDTTTTSTMTTTKTNPTTRTITTTTTTASPLATDALQYLEASPLATESQQAALQWFVDEEVDWADFVADDHLQSLLLDTLQLKAGPRSKFLRWVKSKDILDGNGSMCIKIPRDKAERIQAQRCV